MRKVITRDDVKMYGEISIKRLSLYGFLREIGFKECEIPIKITMGITVFLKEYCDWRANKISPENYWDYPLEELKYLLNESEHRRFALITFTDCDRLIELD